MRPDLLVRYTRWQQVKTNKRHFAEKGLHYDVEEIRNLNYLGDGNPYHTMDVYGPKGNKDILPVVMLIHGGGFDQVLAFYNPTVYQSADILGTFIYRQGIGRADFSYASAVGLFESAVGLMFVMISNFCSKRLTGRTVW